MIALADAVGQRNKPKGQRLAAAAGKNDRKAFKTGYDPNILNSVIILVDEYDGTHLD
ncbi:MULTISPECIES: hypothetical protein [Methylomonas]|uniref:hypothetical protein n=1 Tax=Methylomonas TaxID=416 RepID=UPI000B155564|nr:MULTISPECIES: hypothetical protein [Methylomonas]